MTAVASALVDQGLALPRPTGAAAQCIRARAGARACASWPTSRRRRPRRGSIPTPGDFSAGCARPTTRRSPPGSAPLAAAEAFVFDVEAILNPDAADVDELGRMLRFLKAQRRAADAAARQHRGRRRTASPLLGEVLNMLTRRNLLYTVVRKPDRSAGPDGANRHAGVSRGGGGQPERVRRPRPREARRRQAPRAAVRHQHGDRAPDRRRRRRARLYLLVLRRQRIGDRRPALSRGSASACWDAIGRRSWPRTARRPTPC